MGSQEVIKSRQQRKEDLVYIHGGKCAICSYNRTIKALEFHHINSEDKKYQLSSGNTKSWQSDIEESKKCILVCANCHREIHDNLINFPLISSFKEELFKELNEKRQPKIWKCKKCGAFITTGAEYCAKCSHENQRTVVRPEREELKEMIRNYPFTQLGKQYGVSDNAIRKWCKAEGLPYTKREINSYSDEEWENI